MAGMSRDTDKNTRERGQKQSRLRQLLDNPRIWRGAGPSPAQVRRNIPTGYREFDEWLGGGWPVGVLTELLFDTEGGGELRLLMPALAKLSSAEDSSSWIAWMAPPHIPYPPALQQHGVDVSRVLVTQPDSQQDVLWAMEQSLRSVVCCGM